MKLCAACEKQYEENVRNCGKTIDGFCPCSLILACERFFGPKTTPHTIMPQPPYSPDLAPCDFFLFPKLKRPMKGRTFTTIEEIKTASLEELKAIPKSAYEDWK